MYTSMLEHAVNELKGEEQPQRPTWQLNLGISLRIDESYIPEENQRLRIYKKIAGAGTTNLSEVRAELEDRYGEMPASVHHLAGCGDRAPAMRTDWRFASGPEAGSTPHPIHRRGASSIPDG